jgi:hypothetical protein
MPLNKKGKKIMEKMKEEYGKKKGESVFYAMENSGKLKGVKKAKQGMMTNLKPVPAGKEKSLGKLPTKVRNKMGYAKHGKIMKASKGKLTEIEKLDLIEKIVSQSLFKPKKKSHGGSMKKGYGKARSSGMGLEDESLVPGKGYEYIKDLL